MERVVILGSSSGIGRVIAKKYAARGAHVCIVGRREAKVWNVVEECKAFVPELQGNGNKKVLGFVGDIADAEGMVKLRELLEIEWQGLDTLIVAAGVSAVRPLLSITKTTSPESPTKKANVVTTNDVGRIECVVTAASAALRGNYVGPLVAAVTFIPLLSQTSFVPSIHLISSLASVIPAPTRSLYGSTKSASLILYQCLSIEHPDINWSYVLPSTVQGNFRAGAIDVFPDADDESYITSCSAIPSNSDSATGVTSGLPPEKVADVSILAIDTQNSNPIFIPPMMRFGHWLYWIWPKFVEGRARQKYGFGN